MKVASVLLDGAPAIVAARNDGSIVNIGALVGTNSLGEALRRGVDFASIIFDGAPAIEGHLSFLPPVLNPSRILCAGFNYRDHAVEAAAKIPEHPTFFVRFPSSLVGHKVPLVQPVQSSMLDWEGELAVVIGRAGRHIAPNNALQHVAGYSCFGDHSVRDFQMHSTQATAGKNFDASGAWGPWLVTRDEVPDPETLEVSTRVNGVTRQHGRTADMIFDIAALIAYASSFTTLEPGDVIATGTPSGIGGRMTPPVFLHPGDVVTIEIPRVGTLFNHVVAEVR